MALTVELKGAPALRQELGPARLLPGPRGEAATVAVGSVASGESAAVTNSGDEHDAVFDFVLPQAGPGRGWSSTGRARSWACGWPGMRSTHILT